MAHARALLEGTVLPQGAIVRATGLGLRRLRRLMAAEGWRRPPGAPRCSRAMPPELLARMRALVEGTDLNQRAIARELRVGPNHVSHCIRRHRWVRPFPEHASARPSAVRWPKRPGRPFRADMVPAVRAFYVGTTLSLKEIAARTGVSFAYVGKLGQRHGWVRPDGAPSCTRSLTLGRAGLRRRLTEGRRRVRALAESWATAWASESGSAAFERARALAAPGGGSVVPTPAVRRPPHDPEPVLRLSPTAPRRRRPGQACPDATVAEARCLVEGSSASLGDIAHGLGIGVSALSRWGLDGNWVRPPTAPPWSSRFDPNGWGARSPRLFDARRGLREAESLLRALETAPPPKPADSAPALDRLAEALVRLDEAARAYDALAHPAELNRLGR